MGVPNQDPEQRRRALEQAAAARRERAEMKELLRTGTLTLAEVLDRAEHDEVVARTKVSAVVGALPGMGKVTTKRLLEEIGIAENRRLGGLGSRQRKELLDRFS